MQRYLSALALSPQVLLYPAGVDALHVAPPKISLAQIPSSAFGDGSHPSTRLCAIAVDFLCRTQKIESFLDVGTGTGVLARIARTRGVPFVAGTDIDSLALQAARQNADLDQQDSSITFKNVAPDFWGERFQLIVANILEGPLHDLAPSITRALVPGGQLLLSGFTRIQSPALRVFYQNFRLNVVSESENEGWVLLHLQRS